MELYPAAFNVTANPAEVPGITARGESLGVLGESRGLGCLKIEETDPPCFIVSAGD